MGETCAILSTVLTISSLISFSASLLLSLEDTCNGSDGSVLGSFIFAMSCSSDGITKGVLLLSDSCSSGCPETLLQNRHIIHTHFLIKYIFDKKVAIQIIKLHTYIHTSININIHTSSIVYISYIHAYSIVYTYIHTYSIINTYV